MKKFAFLLTALLCAGAASFAGCMNGQTEQNATTTPDAQTRIVTTENGDNAAEEDGGDREQCPDGKCGHDRMPKPRPGFNSFKPTDAAADGEESDDTLAGDRFDRHDGHRLAPKPPRRPEPKPEMPEEDNEDDGQSGRRTRRHN